VRHFDRVPEPNQRLTTALADRYRVERELGQGGMATVYLAQDLKHDRKVALKVLKPELAAVLGADRFVVEIKTTASLQHPHILPLFDSGTVDGFLFYVMPFIQGETLRDKLTRETQLGVDEAVKIAVDVADALHYAHEHGVIHRDIKPENILLANGRPLVADFGIALAVSAAAGGRMTETGLSLGTPHYMSPEQATAEKEITARSDVYSLASVLYEMLAGVPPHEGGSAQQTIMRIITDTPRPVTDLRRSVPPHVEAAVMKALEKLPADRFASAADFARALGDTSQLTWKHPSRSGAIASASGGRRWLVWVPSAVAAVMTVVAVMNLTRQPVEAPRSTLRFTLTSTGVEEMQSLAISADGGTVAYSATVGGVSRAYVRRLDELDAAPVPGAEGLFDLALLPDGRSLVLANSRQQVSLVPLDGGAARPLVTTTVPAGMSWSSSRGLVLGMPAYSDSIWGLSLVPPAGDSKLSVLTTPKPASMHHGPLVLNDGVTVLYDDILMGGGARSLKLGVGNLARNTWGSVELAHDGIVGFAEGVLVFRDGSTVKATRLDLDGRRTIGEPVVVEGIPPGMDAAVMASNGTMVMHTRSARYQLQLVNERGEGEALLPDTLSHVAPRFAPDGKRAVLVSDVKPDGVVWVLDVAGRTVSKLGFRRGFSADWTPDGRSILIASLGGGVELLPSDGTGGGSAPEFTARFDSSLSGFPIAGITVAPDGRTMVLGTAFGGGFNLVRRQFEGDTTTKPLLTSSATELAPRLSRDGRWLAYSSDESGRQEVYVQPYPGSGGRVQVSTGGGEQPTWSNDGRLFYREGNAMMVAHLSRTADAATVTSRLKLFEGDFYGAGALAASYDVSADGKHFLMARRIDTGGGQLIVWVGWLGDLKAKLGK
jgi:serine/threonine-protein kinase